jgi:LmbE family N-acetylglucosaminyl deacetylase
MTRSIELFGRTLVIAPHPDDEILGAGGTIARLANGGQDVFVAVVTTGQEPEFTADAVKTVKKEAALAHDQLGVTRTYWLDQPAAHLFETPHVVLNDAIGAVVAEVKPKTMIIPFVGDVHVDHQLTFLSSMVSARPHQQKFPTTILAYETMSETNWNAPYLTPGFIPNIFVDIEKTLSKKLEAMRLFQSQLRESPHERSLAALRALATVRGATIHRHAAEAFVMIRHVV